MPGSRSSSSWDVVASRLASARCGADGWLGVGKSAITIRFVTSQFYDQGYNPTIEDSYRKQVVVDDEAATLEILDTAGQEEYAAMADQWYTYGSGFLLVFSLTDRPTFEEIANFHREILRVKDRDYVPCVVVCNKCDLQKYRAVGQLEGRELARSLSAPFIECSAADGVNVEVAFRELVKLVRKDERDFLGSTETVGGSVSLPTTTIDK
nr:Ras-like protein [Cryptococcus depauperatus CBS 7855]